MGTNNMRWVNRAGKEKLVAVVPFGWKPGRINTEKVVSGLRRAGCMDPIIARKWRFNQLEHEEREADKLRDQGYEVFSPTVVCDRVAVKDDKVFFVEFKKPGQKLRPGQMRIQQLVPEMYIVQYSEEK